ncbi:uncharacterized protein PFLUO_LOCUS679 [Penicillium psychrofluorescens]|uniref:uncharacterized protein n=1 Tax=Penicillium psychrofluorescens TaxID=3158075 RepID=UPI003CCD4DEA
MVAAQLDTPPELISTTSGLMTAVRSLGASIGLAINNAIINSTLSKNLVPKVAAATLPLGLPQASLPALITALLADNSSALQSIPGVTPAVAIAALAALKDAYGVAFRNAWITAACFVLVAVIAILFLVDPTEEFNSRIDAPAEVDLVHIQAEMDAEPDHDKAATHLEHIAS